MLKRCKFCKQEKELSNYFQAPKDASASWAGTSEFCIQCHDAGLIKYGYGWYGEKWRTPEETK